MEITLGHVLLFLLMLVSLFLMFVILLQRGRGGGLAGAFGGLGGQSAFGTKAGDVFTVITIVTVVIWVILSCLTAWRLRYQNSLEYRFKGAAAAEPGAAAPDEKSGEAGQPAGDTGKPDEKEDATHAKKTVPGDKVKSGTPKGDSEAPLTIDEKPGAKKDAKTKSDAGAGAKKPDGAQKSKDGSTDKE